MHLTMRRAPQDVRGCEFTRGGAPLAPASGVCLTGQTARTQRERDLTKPCPTPFTSAEQVFKIATRNRRHSKLMNSSPCTVWHHLSPTSLVCRISHAPSYGCWTNGSPSRAVSDSAFGRSLQSCLFSCYSLLISPAHSCTRTVLSTAAFNGGNFSVNTRRDPMHVYPEAIVFQLLVGSKSQATGGGCCCLLNKMTSGAHHIQRASEATTMFSRSGYFFQLCEKWVL